MNRMNYMALDLGSHCGWACDTEAGYSSGVFDLTKDGKFADEGFGLMLATLWKAVEKVSGKKQPLTVFIEKPHAGQFFHATRILFGLMAIVELVLVAKDVPFKYYSPTTIKKFWTGSGKATKAQMLLETKKKLKGIKAVKDHNESDACALLFYGMAVA